MSVGTNTSTNYVESALSLANIATVLTYRTLLSTFRTEAPSKLKWSSFERSDLSRFLQRDIIEECPERRTGQATQNVWQLQQWVHPLLETVTNAQFSDEEISFIARHEHRLTELNKTFTLSDTNLQSRTIGKLRDLGLVELKEDNKHTHSPSVWKCTDRLYTLLNHYENYGNTQ